MFKPVKAVAGAFLLMTAAVAGASAADDQGPVWTYRGDHGPQHWGHLSKGYVSCEAGRRQSPIDLGAADKPGREPAVTVDYKPLPLTILHNGHTVEVVVENGSKMTVDGKEYELLQFHFHTPSEHRVDRKRFDMEIHFVHRAKDRTLAVLALLVEAGAESPALDAWIDHVPAGVSEARTYPDVIIDPGAMVPPLTTFWAYDGSLTTPPCTEGVRWFVEQVPVPMSAQHIAQLAKSMGDNARPLQPVYGRPVLQPQ